MQLNKFECRVRSPQETHALAETLGKAIPPGSFLGMRGPLGAGKTEFTRGIARSLGVEDDISSPTFVMEVIYDLPRHSPEQKVLHLHHWDLYRVRDSALLLDLNDYLNDESRIVVIEWPERIPELQGLLTFEVLLDFPGFAGVSSAGTSGVEPPGTEQVSAPEAGAEERLIEITGPLSPELLGALAKLKARLSDSAE